MEGIYVLTVNDEINEDVYDLYFSTLDKAENFIKNNFSNLRKVTREHYENDDMICVIECMGIDQERL
ncbi:hypothetical protein [Clostridium sp. 1001283B150210_160208_E6]|uniref:hypothetical protein n=1 Tax=Clostridium sp. 1001283B150210_160208_E6 TaxID=2787129 RepID=UPI0018AB0C62|nr:hypothetical protein [Clostridium sp. 1001283B150210_160208_E6]